MDEKAFELNGPRKAAVLIITLGKDLVPQVLQKLSDEEIDRVTLELSRMGEVPDGVMEEVLRESIKRLGSPGGGEMGGFEVAKDLIRSSLEPERADVVLKRISNTLNKGSFVILKDADSQQFLEFVRTEHPQMTALVLSNMEPEQSAKVISLLPEETQVDILKRIATMREVSSEILDEVMDYFQERQRTGEGERYRTLEGARLSADILSYFNQESGDALLEKVKSADQEVGERILKYVFSFDDLAGLEDKDLQKVLEGVDMKQLSLALKGAGEEIKTKFLSNVSERNREMAESEMEYLGAVKKSEVEDARRGILSVFKSLESSGEVVRPGKEQEELIE